VYSVAAVGPRKLAKALPATPALCKNRTRAPMTDEFYTVADATAAADGTAAGPTERAQLVVYYGDEPRTRLIDLPDGAEVSFGRSRTCTVHIDSDRVSRNHARVTRSGREITVEDLDSRNGTRVNGKKIDARTRVSSGDEIAVGPITAVVSVTTRMVQRMPLGSTSYLEERLAAEADRARRYQRTFALIMLRLEGANQDVDDALVRIARNLRPMDVLAEYGPDEFAVVLPEVDRTTGEEAARRIAREAKPADSSPGGLGVRIGLALFPDHGSQPGELLSRAQAALRAARIGGRGDFLATPPEEPAPAQSDVVVGDPQMERVFALARRVADTSITVLICGETGVGKEVVAEAVHQASSRKRKRFVRLNCASIPETLLESELFGHERGAFTGADRRKIGYFEAADGGTIFLDEIGEISAGLQAKLLRVLEEHKFTRVGGTEEIEVDTRVVCATNRDLEDDVHRGRFREDLFFRVSAFTIVVPPLRDRPGEIALLADRFLTQTARDLGVPQPLLSPDALALLSRYAWPGNVRELRNAIERAMVLQTSGVIEVEHMPDRLRDSGFPVGPLAPLHLGDGVDVREQIADIERGTIVAALEACDGNQTRAARKLGLSRRALIYKLEKYGLKPRPGAKAPLP
jgi:diguanylate cyclase (GGDEF)-like protein